ncbi:MAG: hypothetical protein ABIP17_02725 [Ilumatobacteraceae bacterium]
MRYRSGDLSATQVACAESRLAAGELIVAAADLELASRSGRQDNLVAATGAYETARTAATEAVGDADATSLLASFDDLGSADSIPASRTLLLTTEVDAATATVCAIEE